MKDTEHEPKEDPEVARERDARLTRLGNEYLSKMLQVLGKEAGEPPLGAIILVNWRRDTTVSVSIPPGFTNRTLINMMSLWGNKLQKALQSIKTRVNMQMMKKPEPASNKH